ncbi:MAG TPA: hypothetical protein ENH98_00985 [archaeon]|nr:hypothetical protein [archaeon]
MLILCIDFPKTVQPFIAFHISELITLQEISLFFKKLVESFQYKYHISKKTCLAIVRAVRDKDGVIIKKNIKFLEKIKRVTTDKPIIYWLSEVINCLLKKIGE